MQFPFHKNKIHKRVSLTITLILLAFGWTLLWMGTFNKVWVKDIKTGPYKLVVTDVVGPYQNVKGPMDKVYYFLLENGIETHHGAGIYLDKPQSVPAEELRSKVGSIINENDFAKLENLDMDYQILDLPESSRIRTEFIYRNQFSFIIAVMRAYPALNSYMSDHHLVGGPVMEIYDMDNSKIEFIVLNPQEI